MNFENLKNFLDTMSARKAPGCAIEVYYGGKSVYKYASGYSSLEEKTPMTGDELFNIYSCSKIATVTAGLQLLERGCFNLSDPLYEYIPEYRHMGIRTENGIVDAKSPITIRNLFTMTAGFDYDMNTAGIESVREPTHGKMNTAEVARGIAKDPLCFEPGTHWQYSKGHDVLGGLIEIISGMKFRDYMKQYIFDPLDMQDTCYHADEQKQRRICEQYRMIGENDLASGGFDPAAAHRLGSSGDGVIVNIGKTIVEYSLGDEFESGGAGIITTVGDYAKFTAALANNGTGLTGNRILSPFTVRLMKTNMLNDAQMADYNWPAMRGCGYGLGVRTHMDPAASGVMGSIGEFGWGGAAGANAIIDTDLNLGVFFAEHCLCPPEEWYLPRLRNILYSSL